MGALYSWKEDRKASKKAIAFFIQEAIKDKEKVSSFSKDWYKNASTMSIQWAEKVNKKSIKSIAREKLDYTRMRAYMGFVYGNYPIDRPARDLWNSLNI